MHLPSLHELDLGLDRKRSHGHRDHRGVWSTGAMQRPGPSMGVTGFNNETGNAPARSSSLGAGHHRSSIYPSPRQSFSVGSVQEPDLASWGSVATARRPEEKITQVPSPLSSCGSQVHSTKTTSSQSSSTSRASQPRKIRSVRALPSKTTHPSNYQSASPRKPSTSKEHQMREAHKCSEQRRRDQHKALMHELKCAVPQPGHENIKSKTNVGDIAKNEVVNNTLAYIRALLDALVATHEEKMRLTDGIMDLLEELEHRGDQSRGRDDGKMDLTEWIVGRHSSLLSLLPESAIRAHRLTSQLPEIQSASPPNAVSSSPPAPRTESRDIELPSNLRNFLEAHTRRECDVLGGRNGVLARWEDICRVRESSLMGTLMMETGD